MRPTNSDVFDFEKELAQQYPELEFERPKNDVVYRAKGLTGQIILSRSIEHFASKSAMDIDSLGEKNVELLVKNKLVEDVLMGENTMIYEILPKLNELIEKIPIFGRYKIVGMNIRASLGAAISSLDAAFPKCAQHLVMHFILS